MCPSTSFSRKLHFVVVFLYETEKQQQLVSENRTKQFLSFDLRMCNSKAIEYLTQQLTSYFYCNLQSIQKWTF